MLRTLLLSALLSLPVAAIGDDTPVTRYFPVRVAIDAAGSVTSAEPMRAVPDVLREPILAAARAAEFVPATKDGVPVASRTTVSVTMELTPQGENVTARVTAVTAGGGFTMAPPDYPREALRDGYSAVVMVLAAFGPDGQGDATASTIESIRTTGGGGPGRVRRQAEMEAAFREAAVEAIAGWSHLPEEVEGQGVEFVLRVPVSFCAQGGGCAKLKAEAGAESIAGTADTSVRLATLKNSTGAATGG